MRNWLILYIFLFTALFSLVSKCVDFTYMDEYFHARQTWQYINQHDFTTWDPKITTPPGLYIVGFLASWISGSSLTALRFVNLLPVLLWILFSLVWPRTVSRERAAIACCFPLFAFYFNLYYTDVWSTSLVLAGLSVSCPLKSAALFFCSLWFRQTNIIWAAVAAAFKIIDADLSIGQIFANLRPITLRLLRVGPPYISLALLFAVFLKWNGGITLGDQSNHSVSLHFAQVLYFGLFSLLFSAPLILDGIKRERFSYVRRLFLSRSLLIPLEIGVIHAIIKHGTVVHPFILSDNRHYTFYIWRRLITPAGGKLMIPVYWVAWRWFASTVRFSLVRTWVYILATLAVLVPSPLMEPRYYVVPYLVWRLHLYAAKPTNLELFWNLLINCATVAIFCFSKTHFMW